MYQIKVYYTDGTANAVAEFPTTTAANSWWKVNKDDYNKHPKFKEVRTVYVEYSFFKCIQGQHTTFFKVVKVGMNTNNDSTAHIVVKLDANKQETTQVSMLVYGPLKGNHFTVSDEEIWDVMGVHTEAEKKARMKDFLAHRHYFDTPNDADESSWHNPNDRVGTTKIWVPLVELEV